MRDWFDDYGEPENRSAAVDRHLSRIGLTLTGPEKLPGPDAAESPAEIERKRQEAADRLIRHDVLFGVSLGCTIGDEYKITKPSFTAGDEGAP